MDSQHYIQMWLQALDSLRHNDFMHCTFQYRTNCTLTEATTMRFVNANVTISILRDKCDQ